MQAQIFFVHFVLVFFSPVLHFLFFITLTTRSSCNGTTGFHHDVSARDRGGALRRRVSFQVRGVVVAGPNVFPGGNRADSQLRP